MPKKNLVRKELAALRGEVDELKRWKLQHEIRAHGEIKFSEEEGRAILADSKNMPEPSLVRSAHDQALQQPGE